MPCSVYILGGIRCPVKVGVAFNTKRRAQHVRGASPWPVKLLDEWEFDSRALAYAVEQVALAMLRPYRMHGEWFKTSFSEAAGAVEDAIHVVSDLMVDFRGDLARERELWRHVRDGVLAGR